MNSPTPLFSASALAILLSSTAAQAAVSSSFESFDGGVENWSTTLSSGGAVATINSIASGGEDGGAYLSQTGDALFGAFGPVAVVYRCNNDGASACSDGNFFGDYDPAGHDTTISFYLRHDAGQSLDFFARLAPDTNSPGAGTGNDFVGSVASGVWTQLSLDIEANFFDSFSGTDFDTVFSNTIERLQIGVNLPFNPIGGTFNPLIGVTYDLDSVSLTNTPVPLPASFWLLGTAIASLSIGGKIRR